VCSSASDRESYTIHSMICTVYRLLIRKKNAFVHRYIDPDNSLYVGDLPDDTRDTYGRRVMSM
jgi:hypothetical protein